MSDNPASIVVQIDPTNPGQFFACCGLFELADRLWPGAEGWFEQRQFCMARTGSIAELIRAVASAELSQIDPLDHTASPILLGRPFRALRLDWWQDVHHLDRRLNGKELKVWAGTMESFRIAKAMQLAMRSTSFQSSDLFDVGMITHDVDEPTKKVEPYYFDARRCPNAHSRDVGFSPNDLGMTTIAWPAVELLCLVGLQTARGAPTAKPRIYDYFTWTIPIPSNLLLPVATGVLGLPGQQGYRFENWYRTGQKKHKAFRSATPLTQAGD